MLFLQTHRRNNVEPRPHAATLFSAPAPLEKSRRRRLPFRRNGFLTGRAFGIFGVFVISLSLLAPLQFSLIKQVDGIVAIQGQHAIAYASPQSDFEACIARANGGSSLIAKCNEDLRAAQRAGGANATPSADKAGQCSWAANWNICFTNIIYVFTVGLGSALAYIASTILNTAVVLALDSTPYALQFITESWSLVRDLANMAFLFILVYIAFTIMLKAETAGVMQTLAMVIVMAVLINFSFFLTRVVIDGGNILAVQFYNAIPPVAITNGSASQPSGASGGGITNGCLAALFKADLCKNARDLTAVIMNSIQIQNILGTDSFTALANDKNTGTAGTWVATLISLSLVYIVMGVMFFMLMGAFLYAAVLFITRIVTLWLLIIVAPLALAAEAIPAARFKGYYQEWQSMLISNTFYPAMFLFIFLVLSKLMKSLGQSLGGTSFVGVGDSATFLSIIAGTVGVVVIKLGLVLGLLMVGLSFAKRVSTSMGETSQHLASAVSGWAQGKVRGATIGFAANAPAATLRNTAGWLGQRSFESNWLRNRAAKGGALSRTAWRTAGRLGEASFDVRNARMPFSKSQEGGYRAAYDARVKRREDEAEALKPSKGKVEQAERAVLNALTDSQRKELATLAERYSDAIKDNKELNNPQTKTELKNARTAYNNKFKDLEIAEKVKKITGKENAVTYANSVTKRSWNNMWKLHSAGFTTQASYEASARLRKAISEEEGNPKAGASRIRSLIDTIEPRTSGRTPAGRPAPAGQAPADEPERQGFNRRGQTSSLDTDRLIKGMEQVVDKLNQTQEPKKEASWKTSPSMHLDEESGRVLREVATEIRKSSKNLQGESAALEEAAEKKKEPPTGNSGQQH